MIEVFQTTVDNGLDSSAFRKFKYRLAVLNESHYGDSGVEIIVRLIAENPYYDQYHATLFWMLRKHRSEIKFIPDESNPLMSALMDGETTQSDFLSALRKERKTKSPAWKAYRECISRLK